MLPALVHLVCLSEEKARPAASEALFRVLKHHNQKPEVICMMLDSLRYVAFVCNFLLPIFSLTSNQDQGKHSFVHECVHVDVQECWNAYMWLGSFSKRAGSAL